MKEAKNLKEAFDIEEKFEGQPHAWLQWKGTSVCMDLHCECGFHSHIHDDFTYRVQCPSCGAVYACNGHIELIKLTDPNEDQNAVPPKMDTNSVFVKISDGTWTNGEITYINKDSPVGVPADVKNALNWWGRRHKPGEPQGL